MENDDIKANERDLARVLSRVKWEFLWTQTIHFDFRQRVLRILCGYVDHQRRSPVRIMCGGLFADGHAGFASVTVVGVAFSDRHAGCTE